MKPGNHIYLIGIGGISMSGIADILLKKGYQVSGSDVKDSHLLDKLRSQGAKIYIGHNALNAAGADLVVYSSAITSDNPEMEYARKNNLPILKRAQMLARLMKEKKGIAIAGTHGKTTTTSMIATLLIKGGYDPSVLVGGELDIIDGNSYLGSGDYLVTEADESDGSFLYYNPQVVVVTNIEMDHQEYFGSDENLLKIFKEFINKIPENGSAVLCAEDSNLEKIIAGGDSRFLTFGFEKGFLRAVDCKSLPFGSYYNLIYKDKLLGEINLQVPGRHNILNSLAAIGVALYAGMEFMDIKKGLENYRGVRRRFEKKGMFNNILVIDDYAHHPTEIKATLKAARNTGFRRVIAVFQPHRYTRTQFLMEEFAHSFDLVDQLIITDIYAAGEKPIPGVKAGDLARLITRYKNIKVDYISEMEDIVAYLEKVVQPEDLIITIGAGDVYRVGEVFLEKMKKIKEMA
jgi:UDP-N-acetylmuramate--alanine ligase